MTRSQRELEDAWRRHAARPPDLSPEDAAARVLRRLAERHGVTRRGRHHWRLAAAALLLVVLLAAAVLLRLPAAPSAPPRAGEVAETALSSDGVVVLWLDEETPLYLTLEPPADGAPDRKETIR